MKAAIAFFGLCLCMSHAFGASLPIKKGEPFVHARKALLRHKWKPVPRHLHDGYEYGGLDRLLKERGFKEMESCTVDTSQCIFYYRKAGACLRLDTIGEQVDEMTVVQWSSECPDQPAQPSH